ncbi:MAG: gliding motility-associated protein GldE [Bacteroides sp.]|nr:gliding motility-associated protein GldE [Bacteroides sp.]
MEDSPDPYSCCIPPLLLFIDTIPANAILGIAAIIVLLIFSAMVSGSEVAFFSLTHSHVKDIRKKKTAACNNIITLLEKPKRLLATILIANNVINIAIILISTMVFRELFSFEASPVLGFLVQVILITFILLLFGEVMPKVYSGQHPVKFASFMSTPLIFVRKIFWPLSSLLVRSTRLIDERLGKKRSNISMDDLSHALEITADNTTSEEDKKILRGIVSFGNIDAREIMRSRLDVVAVEVTLTFSQLLPVILDAGYSRIPVYRDSFDNVEGILYIKDLLPYLEKGDEFDWTKLVRPCFFVPESKKISDLLREFQEKKIHMAVVVDEYGGTSGIVTLEDILEEIVGEINDEFDIDEGIYSKLDSNTYVFEGRTLLKDFCKITGANYDIFAEVKGEADTLAGLLLEIKQELPFKGEKVHFRNFEFLVEGVDNRRIKRIKVAILPESRE